MFNMASWLDSVALSLPPWLGDPLIWFEEAYGQLIGLPRGVATLAVLAILFLVLINVATSFLDRGPARGSPAQGASRTSRSIPGAQALRWPEARAGSAGPRSSSPGTPAPARPPCSSRHAAPPYAIRVRERAAHALACAPPLQLMRGTDPHTVTSMKEGELTGVLHSERDAQPKPKPVHVVDFPGHRRLRG